MRYDINPMCGIHVSLWLCWVICAQIAMLQDFNDLQWDHVVVAAGFLHSECAKDCWLQISSARNPMHVPDKPYFELYKLYFELYKFLFKLYKFNKPFLIKKMRVSENYSTCFAVFLYCWACWATPLSELTYFTQQQQQQPMQLNSLQFTMGLGTLAKSWL